MRLVSYDNGGRPSAGVVVGEEVVALAALDGTPTDITAPLADMIAAVSRVCTLEPGDLIATGTPGGVGIFSGKLLQPGQHVRVEIEGVGTIDNPVVAEPTGA